MSVDPKIFARVRGAFSERRRSRENEAAERRAEAYRLIPELSGIDARIAETAAGLIKLVISGGDPDALMNTNLSLQARRRETLENAGLPCDYTDVCHDCALCGDSGYVLAEPCDCLREAFRAEQARELTFLLNIERDNFDSFDFEYYSSEHDPQFGSSPRANMERVYDFCIDYARRFSRDSRNLFLCGGVGLGKTFLSACIAREVASRGYSVVYDTAVSIFAAFEAEKFGRDEEASGDARRYMGCDLLIMDDLGTEMSTNFTNSALYSLINSRLLSGIATIINSNLSQEELARRYPPQIVSRLEGDYLRLLFFGKDIRRLKNRPR